MTPLTDEQAAEEYRRDKIELAWKCLVQLIQDEDGKTAFSELEITIERAFLAGLAHKSKQLEVAVEALEKITATRTFTESQSTGVKYYHKTEGAEIAEQALTQLRSPKPGES